MDKCWFVLRQTHYPPPRCEDCADGSVKQFGPLCLGHFIQDLKHLDQVINSDAPVQIPFDVPIFETRATNFEWEHVREKGFDISANAGVPIAMAAGATAKAELSVAFKQNVQRHWEIERLDTSIIQPSRRHITSCLASASVADFLGKKVKGMPWSVYMITGLIIARGKNSSRVAEGRETEVSCGPGIFVSGIAEAGLSGGNSSGASIAASAEHTTDFVWAIRLAKVRKGFLTSKWDYVTETKGAVFDVNSTAADVASTLDAEGFAPHQTTIVGTADDLIQFLVV